VRGEKEGASEQPFYDGGISFQAFMLLVVTVFAAFGLADGSKAQESARRHVQSTCNMIG
jgi:hypothetical protein